MSARRGRSCRELHPAPVRSRDAPFYLGPSLKPPLTTVSHPHARSDLIAIVQAAVTAASASTLVQRATARGALPGFDRSHPTTLIAAGKAAAIMASTYLAHPSISCTRGLVVTTDALLHASPQVSSNVERIAAGHPVPTEGSARAGRRALELAAVTPPQAQLVVLLSGGASALLAAPDGSITLDDKQATTAALLRAGAAIHDLNCVRKHLSAIKGGRLAAASPSPTFTLAISDVVAPIEDDPSVIGSGPTVADPSTFGDACDVLGRLGVEDAVPSSARALLERGARGGVDETPKPGDPRLGRGGYLVIGSRRSAMHGAQREAERLGYRVHVIDGAVTGEARDIAPHVLAQALARAADAAVPCCIISSGETTVRVRGAGKGGRNQELALALVDAVAAAPRPVWLASVGSDGIDGPTDAAGAVVDPFTRRRAEAVGLDVRRALASNDAYHFFDPLGDLVRTGPTETNVGDVQVALVL